MALFSAFYDDFNDNVRDATKWSVYPTNVFETAGTLKWIEISGNQRVNMVGTRDLFNDTIVWDTELQAGMSYGSYYFDFFAFQGNDQFRIGYRRTGTKIQFLSGNIVVGNTSLDYDTPYRYLRVRVVADFSSTVHRCYYESSPNGTTWTLRWTHDVLKTQYSLLGMGMSMGTFNYQGSPLSRTPTINAVNSAPIVPTGPAVFVWDGATKIPATAKVWNGTAKLAATAKIAP